MAQAVPARLDAHFEADPPAAERLKAPSSATAPGGIRLAVYEDLSAIEEDWRAFEPHADCTVFQSFDWLATWQRHIGACDGVRPAIVVGRDAAGSIMFLLPLSVCTAGLARELAWLGSELCDYNAPLLAMNFSERFDRARFLSVWTEIIKLVQANPRLHHDTIILTKMPEMVGAQANPMRYLGGAINPSGAYLTHLTGDWDTFYTAKRSSATRRRDRTKRKKLSEIGEVRYVNPAAGPETLRTLETLMEQKAQAFAHMGVANLFAKPGHADFYRALAGDPATRHLVHVSRLDVGKIPAAVNLGLTYRDCYYHLLASYDEGDVSRFGPGAAHLHELMREAIGRGLRIFDFTIGDERYKRDWCDTELKLYDYIAAATWRGMLVAGPLIAAKRVKRWIKQTPLVWNAFGAARAFVGSLARLFRR
ncbi:MAG TPA: GNAT family N-acetyltransferase [Pseudolabrys sp.]|jgi:CelD/BcsL family acetyltransferase involved in cellulose biosynthesis